MSGDQANCNHKIGEEINTEEEEKAKASNKRIVETLASLHKASGKVIYIPGNHDA